MSSPVTIGTHNGAFHCDEVTACFLLKQLPRFKEAEIRRSRDPSVLEACDVVVDVGGVYDPAINRFDHHQRDFNHTFNSIRPEKPWTIKLSSAGLVYCHFGRQVLVQLTGLQADDNFVDKVFDLMYENFIKEIDAIDNGVAVSSDLPTYQIHTGISSRVGHLNPWWNDKSNQATEDELFAKAMQLVGAEFTDRLKYYQHCWWPARQLVSNALAARFKYCEQGRILVFDNIQGGLPWKGHLFELEREQNLSSDNGVLFTLYSDSNGAWRVQAVPPDEQQLFANRLPLPAAWRGLRDQELSDKAGIDACVFVHSSGFIGGNRTFEGALSMAKRAIELANKEAEAKAEANGDA